MLVEIQLGDLGLFLEWCFGPLLVSWGGLLCRDDSQHVQGLCCLQLLTGLVQFTTGRLEPLCGLPCFIQPCHCQYIWQ